MQISYHPRIPDLSRADDETEYYAKGWQTLQIKMFGQFLSVIKSHCWSPCVWKNGHRLKRNFLSADFIAFDIDSPGSPTLADAMRTWCDAKHVIGPTKSHQKPKHGVVCDRYRVIVKTDVRIEDLGVYEYNEKIAIDHYGADKACRDGGRFFFPCTDIAQSLRDGETWVVKEVPESAVSRSDVGPQHAARCKRMINTSFIDLMRAGIPAGERTSKTFTICCAWFDAGYSRDEVTQLMTRSNITLEGGRTELDSIINNALNYGQNRGRWR